MTPRILDSIVLISCGFDGCFDLMRIAVVSKTVAIGFSPAAFMVSPDSAYQNISQLPQSYVYNQRGQHTNKIYNSVRHAQSTSCLDTPTNILNLGFQSGHTHCAGGPRDIFVCQSYKGIDHSLRFPFLTLELGEISTSKPSETGDDILPDQLSWVDVLTHLRNLDLEFAHAESKVQNLLNICARLRHLIAAGDP